MLGHYRTHIVLYISVCQLSKNGLLCLCLVHTQDLSRITYPLLPLLCYSSISTFDYHPALSTIFGIKTYRKVNSPIHVRDCMQDRKWLRQVEVFVFALAGPGRGRPSQGIRRRPPEHRKRTSTIVSQPICNCLLRIDRILRAKLRYHH